MEVRVTPLTPEREEAERKKLRAGKNARATVAAGGVIRSDVGGVEVLHHGACVFLTVRDGSDERRALERYCTRFGLVRECVSEGEPTLSPDGFPVAGLNVWKVVGNPAALAELAEPNHIGRLWWVADAALGMNARVGGSAAGAGELSESAKRHRSIAISLHLKDGERPPTEGEMVRRERAQAFIERQRKLRERKQNG